MQEKTCSSAAPRSARHGRQTRSPEQQPAAERDLVNAHWRLGRDLQKLAGAGEQDDRAGTERQRQRRKHAPAGKSRRYVARFEEHVREEGRSEAEENERERVPVAVAAD